jgi:hypothetical protein
MWTRPKRIGVAYMDSTGHARLPARTNHPELAAEKSTDQLGVYEVRGEGDRRELYVQYESVWVGPTFVDRNGIEYPGRHNYGVSVVSADCDLEPRIWVSVSRFTSWRLFE